MPFDRDAYSDIWIFKYLWRVLARTSYYLTSYLAIYTSNTSSSCPTVDFAMQHYASHNRRNPASRVLAKANIRACNATISLRRRFKSARGIYSRLRYKNSYSKRRERVHVTRTRFHVGNPCKSHIFVVIWKYIFKDRDMYVKNMACILCPLFSRSLCFHAAFTSTLHLIQLRSYSSRVRI